MKRERTVAIRKVKICTDWRAAGRSRPRFCYRLEHVLLIVTLANCGGNTSDIVYTIVAVTAFSQTILYLMV